MNLKRGTAKIVKLIEREKVVYYNSMTGETECPTTKKSVTLDQGLIAHMLEEGAIYVCRKTKDLRDVLRMSKDYYAAVAE